MSELELVMRLNPEAAQSNNVIDRIDILSCCRINKAGNAPWPYVKLSKSPSTSTAADYYAEASYAEVNSCGRIAESPFSARTLREAISEERYNKEINDNRKYWEKKIRVTN